MLDGACRIKDLMGDVVILPNSKFSSCTITNFSQPEPASYRWVTLILDASRRHHGPWRDVWRGAVL